MSPEAQRIAIAEACGWKRYNAEGLDAYHPEKPDARFPDYLNDLNAMHEAESYLSGNQFNLWAHILSEVCARTEDGPIHLLTGRASAAQRAEAFLRTLNLWEDSP